MLSRRALVTCSAAGLATRSIATTRALLDDSNNSKYDRDAELKREEQARANLFQQGMPNPFKVGQAAAGGGAQGQAGGKPMPSFKEAGDQAWRDASKRFFGTDLPPPQFNFIARAMGRPVNDGSGNASASSSDATTTTSNGSSDANASSSSSSTTSSSGQQMPNPFANFAGAGGNAGGAGMNGRPPPNTSRLLAGLIITYCSFWMMRRQGFFGHFDHVLVPYWAVGPVDSAQWLIFVNNIDEPRREELQRGYEAQRRAYPSMTFFDYVDQQQPDWISTPNFSKAEVVSAVAAFVAKEPTWKVLSTIRAGLGASDGIFAALGITGDGGSGLSAPQRRIESLMRILPGAAGGPGGAAMARPFVMARATDTSGNPTGGWQPMYNMGATMPPPGYAVMGGPPGMGMGGYSQQPQQQSGQWSGYQQGHGTAPFGMPPQQQQQQQQQQQWNSGNGQWSPSQQQYGQQQQQYGQQQQWSGFDNNNSNATTSNSNNNTGDSNQPTPVNIGGGSDNGGADAPSGGAPAKTD
eukprot:CAMPEP_0174830626 /NCGR_PEP_ID=MMETSP1114-20130205/2616_1 /TAXON_ID=312471 /ORGANISM="Neobodo designis, Strain CCAP 1951/1" /LENGTH=521 /DNA_ID=CAMNT_0016064427 /DNA_START=79 /DNA_END=1644 /DNA_ORIENTATION=+